MNALFNCVLSVQRIWHQPVNLMHTSLQHSWISLANYYTLQIFCMWCLSIASYWIVTDVIFVLVLLYSLLVCRVNTINGTKSSHCFCQFRYYRRIPQLRPPFVHASIGQNRGGGLIGGIVIFTCDDHYRPANATWARDPCELFLWQFQGVVTTIPAVLTPATGYFNPVHLRIL